MSDDASSSSPNGGEQIGYTNGSGSWLHRFRNAFASSERRDNADGSTMSDPAQSPPPSAAAALRLSNTQRFETLRVDDVMVPRADIIAVEIDTPLMEVARLIAESAHSRLPVYRETLDEPLGLVHIRDVVPHLIQVAPAATDDAASEAAQAAEPPHLKSILRSALYVPSSMPAADLLLKMQSRRVHMAIVVDEFGGTDGLVTLEDLVEEIVGDIEDEHDEDEAPLLKTRSAHCWEAEARIPLEDIEKELGVELAAREEAEDIDTLGGLVFTMVNRIPERGEIISHPDGFDFEVLDADARRIKRVVIRRRESRPPASASSDTDAAL